MKTFEYNRTWSFFEPTFAYNVVDLVRNRSIGAVARNPGQRRWYASNRTWAGGDDLPGTFRTRHDAAVALRFAADAEHD